MQHFFDIDFATEYGLNEAIIANNLWYWIKKNEANKKHFHEGKYWTYNSVKALKKLFPYLSEKQIRNALANLTNKGIIVKGNFNFSTYDRTLWYAFSSLGNTILLKGQMDMSKRANGFAPEGEPIPNNITTNNNSNNNIYIVEQVIKHLNEITNSNYKSTTRTTRDKIIARLNEGFTLDDFIVVIDKKYWDWKGTTFEQYMRPETLFGTKFESYLNQPVKKKTTKDIKLDEDFYRDVQNAMNRTRGI